jgi:hypothetical protein
MVPSSQDIFLKRIAFQRLVRPGQTILINLCGKKQKRIERPIILS